MKMTLKKIYFAIALYQLLILPSHCWRPYIFEFTNVTATSQSHVIALNASVSNSGSQISIYTHVLEPIPSFHASFLFLMESLNGIFDMEVINRTINICALVTNPRYEPIIQVFYRAIMKSATVPRKCPIQKKLYYFKDVEIDTEGFPPAMPLKKYRVEIALMVKKGKILNSIGSFFFGFEFKPSHG